MAFRRALVGLLSLAATFWIGAADAATLVPGSTTALGANAYYDYGADLLGNQPITGVDFDFTIAAQLGAINTAATFRPNGTGGIGVADFTLTWLDSLNQIVATLIVTNSLGVMTSALPTLMLTLLAGETYKLVLSGTALANGGHYIFDLTTTPLPPALVLFGTALVGLTLLGRRRRASANPL